MVRELTNELSDTPISQQNYNAKHCLSVCPLLCRTSLHKGYETRREFCTGYLKKNDRFAATCFSRRSSWYFLHNRLRNLPRSTFSSIIFTPAMSFSDSFFRYPMVPWVWEITSFLLRLLAESASRQEMMAYFLAVFLGLGSSSYKPALGWACSSHPY